MATITTKLTATGTIQGANVALSKTFSVPDVKEFRKFEAEVGSADAPSLVWDNGANDARGLGITVGAKFIVITNTGSTALEVFQGLEPWNASEVNGTLTYVSSIISPNAFIALPTQRSLIYAALTSAGGNATVTNGVGAAQFTNGNGYIKTSTMFGQADGGGIVPGSINIDFYKKPWIDFGFMKASSSKLALTSTDSTGLAVGTAYDFGLNVNGGGVQNISFTTHSSDVTWGTPDSTTNGVLGKITLALETAYLARTIQILPKIAIADDGDLRITGAVAFDDSTLVLSAGSSNTVFGKKIFPALGEGTTFNSTNTFDAGNPGYPGAPGFSEDDLLIDNGDGTGTRVNGGSFTFKEGDDSGDRYKEGGLFIMSGCPKHTDFRVSYNHNSAHAGIADATAGAGNSIVNISARSLSAKKNGFVEVTVFN